MRLALLIALVVVVRAGAEDVVHLRDGITLRGEIVRYLPDATQLKITLEGASGEGSTVRTLRNADIRLIDFEVSDADAKVLASGDVRAVNALWSDRKRLLDRPNSNAGAIGLRLAEARLALDSQTGRAAAREIYAEIEGKDWDARRRSAARRGRLKTLIAMGDAEAAMAEAMAMEAETEDPDLFLDARHVLAVFDYQKLENLIEENPRWPEDDTVRDTIRALYNGTVDRFLHAYLFYGSEGRAAARGLLHAARAHRLVKRDAEARACAGDILKLYQQTEFAPEARRFLESETQTNKDTKKK